MVKHPWPLLEISLSDFRRLATLNMITYLTYSDGLEPFFFLRRRPDTRTEMFTLLRFHSLSFRLFGHFFCFYFDARSVTVVLGFPNGSIFGDSVKNKAFSNISVFKYPHLNSVFKRICLDRFA